MVRKLVETLEVEIWWIQVEIWNCFSFQMKMWHFQAEIVIFKVMLWPEVENECQNDDRDQLYDGKQVEEVIHVSWIKVLLIIDPAELQEAHQLHEQDRKERTDTFDCSVQPHNDPLERPRCRSVRIFKTFF